jgi:hypothetical protein
MAAKIMCPVSRCRIRFNQNTEGRPFPSLSYRNGVFPNLRPKRQCTWDRYTSIHPVVIMFCFHRFSQGSRILIFQSSQGSSIRSTSEFIVTDRNTKAQHYSWWFLLIFLKLIDPHLDHAVTSSTHSWDRFLRRFLQSTWTEFLGELLGSLLYMKLIFFIHAPSLSVA